MDLKQLWKGDERMNLEIEGTSDEVEKVLRAVAGSDRFKGSPMVSRTVKSENGKSMCSIHLEVSLDNGR